MVVGKLVDEDDGTYGRGLEEAQRKAIVSRLDAGERSADCTDEKPHYLCFHEGLFVKEGAVKTILYSYDAVREWLERRALDPFTDSDSIRVYKVELIHPNL